MDELTSIAVWFIVIVMSVNSGILYLDATDTFKDNGFSLGLAEGTVFSSSDLPITTLGENLFSGDLLQTAFAILNMIKDSFLVLIVTVFKVYFAWAYLLEAVMLGIPGANFFTSIVGPIFGMIQLVATFIIASRVGSIVAGLIP